MPDRNKGGSIDRQNGRLDGDQRLRAPANEAKGPASRRPQGRTTINPLTIVSIPPFDRALRATPSEAQRPVRRRCLLRAATTIAPIPASHAAVVAPSPASVTEQPRQPFFAATPSGPIAAGPLAALHW